MGDVKYLIITGVGGEEDDLVYSRANKDSEEDNVILSDGIFVARGEKCTRYRLSEQEVKWLNMLQVKDTLI